MSEITLGHGSGGRLMHNLVKGLLLKKLDNPLLRELADSALINYREPFAFTTDSFVVSPLFFPGGDIGKLAVCGTVNDLVMQGAHPEYLSLALIIEEGFSFKALEKIVGSVSLNAKKAGVYFVTGDIKVVEKGAADKIFINTSGLGRLVGNRRVSIGRVEPGDKIIVSADIGRHGLAVFAKRKELDFGFDIPSDCAALNHLLIPILKNAQGIKFMRDPTRGGLATTLCEIAEGASLGVVIEEKEIPLTSRVKACCELLGIDPLYLANEGCAVLVVESRQAEKILSRLKKHPLGKRSRIIGSIAARPKGRVILNTSVGTQRIIDMFSSEQLPRIC